MFKLFLKGDPCFMAVMKITLLSIILSSVLGSCTSIKTIDGSVSIKSDFKVELESLKTPGSTIVTSTPEEYGVTLTINREKAPRGALRFSLTVLNNGTDYAVSHVSGLAVTGFSVAEPGELLTTQDGGKRIPAESFRRNNDLSVPAINDGFHGTMSWFAFAGPEDGLYFGIENTTNSHAKAVITYDKTADDFVVSHDFHRYCHPGESYTTPVIDVHPYKGDWHAAADYYRQWYLSVNSPAHRPEWLRDCSGWLLAILKQQNGQVIWPYESIGRELADAAEARGLNVIGIFGRGVGGHDCCYPDYSSDPALGGEESFRKGIEELHARGMHCIFYVNGQLIDNLSPWFYETGQHISVMNADGKLKSDSYQKFKNGRNVGHSLACLQTRLWRDMMVKLAEDANNLGADGIIFDQLGRFRPRVCYSPDHGHKVPFITYQEDLIECLSMVYEHMQAINPDFVLMTEGFNDRELPSVAFYHRGAMKRIISQKAMEGLGLHPSEGYMAPEILKYTLPEVVNTSNDPAPMNERQRLNLNAVFNERTEIEVRYDFDRDLIESDRLQDPSCFDNINGMDKANGRYHLKMATTGDPKAARTYSYQIHNWLGSHSELMREGRFMDDKMFTFSSDNPLAIAKSYVSADGKTLGVIVWNISTKDSASFTIAPAKGFRLTEVSAPDGTPAAGDPVPPQSVQLYVYRK